MPESFRVALVQSRPTFGEPDANLDSLVAAIRGAEADLFVLPELCLSGYDFEDRAEVARYAEPSDGPRVSALADAACAKGAAVAFGFAETGPGGSLFNSALLAIPGGPRRAYRKTHLFSREKLLFENGDTGFFVERHLGVGIGLAVCFDWIFPESFRTLALRGADIVAHCSNLVLPFCQRADFTRAIENRVYVATANRVGSEERGGRSLTFTGESVMVAPDGEYLARLSKDEPGVVVADIDPIRARDKRINAFNDVLSDRRPEMYATEGP